MIRCTYTKRKYMLYIYTLYVSVGIYMCASRILYMPLVTCRKNHSVHTIYGYTYICVYVYPVSCTHI